MHEVTVTELELLEFFSATPRLADPDVPWIYNDVIYEVQSENLALSFALAPSYKDVRLMISCSGTKLYELNAVGVRDVVHRKGGERESLEIRITDQDTLYLFLSPSIELHQSVEEHA